MERDDKDCCPQGMPQAMCNQPSPEEYIRLRARFFRDQSHELEQLADALERDLHLPPQIKETLTRIIALGLSRDGRF